MKLEDWKNSEGKSYAQIGDETSSSSMTVRRHAKEETLPQSKEDYKAYFFASKGRVSPNDFFPIHEWKEQLKKSRHQSVGAEK